MVEIYGHIFYSITAKAGASKPIVTTIQIPVRTPAPEVTGTLSPKPSAGIPTWLISVVIGAAGYFLVLTKK
jgi:hypothetical protein